MENRSIGSIRNALQYKRGAEECETRALGPKGEGQISSSTSAASSRRNLEQSTKFGALNQVLAWERDAAIEEQKKTIVKLQEENASLRQGNGPVGEVLLHNWLKTNPNMDEDTRQRLMDQKAPVNMVIHSLGELADVAKDLAKWGRFNHKCRFLFSTLDSRLLEPESSP